LIRQNKREKAVRLFAYIPMDTDFLITGGGVVGLATAQHLLERGATVTVLERGEAGQESSWAGGGILSPLCPWDYPDEVTRLTIRSAALFGAWAAALHEATGIDPEYEVSGMLVLPPFDMQVARQWCAARSMPVQQVSATDYALPVQDNALCLPQVAQVRNPRLMRALQKQVEMLGGRIIEQCEVREVLADKGYVAKLATSRGEFSAGNYIIAAGAWSRKVMGRYALHLDVRPMRGQMLLFKFDVPPVHHVVLQGEVYLIPRRDGHLLVGSTLEDAGFDRRTTDTARNMLQQRAQGLLPQLHNMSPVRHWAGLRPASPRNIPAIGRHPNLKNLYLNTGHFRYGVTMAPASAEILLNEITGKPQSFDVEPYRTWWKTETV
jgi:glycine oxidase